MIITIPIFRFRFVQRTTFSRHIFSFIYFYIYGVTDCKSLILILSISDDGWMDKFYKGQAGSDKMIQKPDLIYLRIKIIPKTDIKF